MRNLILASTSPRRKEIFEKTKLPFTIVSSNYEEDMTLELPPHELVQYLSEQKAASVMKDHPDSVIIGADSFVIFGDTILSKPHTPEKARDMLQLLRGKQHEIISGVAIIDTASGKKVSFYQKTKIFMKDYSDQTIDAYIATGEPLDRAGAYALQELGALLIEKIDGDFFSAVGLPLGLLCEHLKDFGITVLD